MSASTISVLLVEDDDVVRTSMTFALASAHIRVVEAATVAEGTSRFRQGLTDVVVIDLHLPDGTGYDLARWLRQRQPLLPMVMISTDPEDIADAFPTTVNGGRMTTLAKPFSASALLDAISLVAATP